MTTSEISYMFPWPCTTVQEGMLAIQHNPICQLACSDNPEGCDALKRQICTNSRVCTLPSTMSLSQTNVTEFYDVNVQSAWDTSVEHACTSNGGSWTKNDWRDQDICFCVNPERSSMYQNLLTLNNKLTGKTPSMESLPCWFPPCGVPGNLLLADQRLQTNNCPQDRFLCSTGNIDVNQLKEEFAPDVWASVSNVCSIVNETTGEIYNVNPNGNSFSLQASNINPSPLVTPDPMFVTSWFRMTVGVGVGVALLCIILLTSFLSSVFQNIFVAFRRPSLFAKGVVNRRMLKHLKLEQTAKEKRVLREQQRTKEQKDKRKEQHFQKELQKTVAEA